MFAQETFINKKILIYGLGISGKSSFKYLTRKNKVTLFDDNINLRNNKNKKFFLNKKKYQKKNLTL